jgi:hypothetical protein
MWRLLQKNAAFFVFYLLIFACIFFPLLNQSRAGSTDSFDFIYVFYQGSWIFWIVLGPIWGNEQIESKNKGYIFLSTLPIKKRDIVISKYILVFLSVVFFVGFYNIAILFYPTPPEHLTLIQIFIGILGGMCLMISGVVYLGIFRFGFSRLSKFIFALWILLFLSPVFFREFLMPKFNISPQLVVQFIGGVNWILFSVFSTVIFISTMWLSIKQVDKFME